MLEPKWLINAMTFMVYFLFFAAKSRNCGRNTNILYNKSTVTPPAIFQVHETSLSPPHVIPYAISYCHPYVLSCFPFIFLSIFSPVVFLTLFLMLFFCFLPYILS